jgi:hypothetical protein
MRKLQTLPEVFVGVKKVPRRKPGPPLTGKTTFSPLSRKELLFPD